jgi:hypothetical protein
MSSSATKKRAQKLDLPDNVTISTAFLAPIDDMVKAIFVGIFHDYCRRFKADPSKNPVHVAIAGTDSTNPKEPYQVGMTTIASDHQRILVEVRDPTLSAADDTTHLYVAVKFVEVLCHEMVHVMQTVCERDVKETYGVLHDGADEGESYFFDPYEIEARLLESFYAHSFGKNLITSSMEETK